VYGEGNSSDDDRGIMFRFWQKKKLCIIYLFYCFTVLGEGEVPVSCYSEARCLGYSWGNDQGSFCILFKLKWEIG
jgi:hypothetical protein